MRPPNVIMGLDEASLSVGIHVILQNTHILLLSVTTMFHVCTWKSRAFQLIVHPLHIRLVYCKVSTNFADNKNNKVGVCNFFWNNKLFGNSELFGDHAPWYIKITPVDKHKCKGIDVVTKMSYVFKFKQDPMPINKIYYR